MSPRETAVAPPVGFSPDILRKIVELETAVGAAIRGKPEVVRLSLVSLLARGHLLIEDVPGVGKTTLAQALARVFVYRSRCPPAAVHERHAAERCTGSNHLQRALGDV